MTEQELISSVQALIPETRALRKSVQELAARTVRSEANIRRSKRAIRWTIVGVTLDILLTIIAAFLFNDQRETSARLESTITAQQILRAKAVCPLYGEFFKSYHPELKRPGKERADYVATFSRLREQAAALDCAAS